MTHFEKSLFVPQAKQVQIHTICTGCSLIFYMQTKMTPSRWYECAGCNWSTVRLWEKVFFMVDIILDEKKKAVVLQGNSSYCKCEQNNPDYPHIHVVRSANSLLTYTVHRNLLTLSMLWSDSADDKLMIFFLFFLGNRIWHFMQIVSLGDSLHEMSNPILGDNLHKMSNPIF